MYIYTIDLLARGTESNLVKGGVLEKGVNNGGLHNEEGESSEQRKKGKILQL